MLGIFSSESHWRTWEGLYEQAAHDDQHMPQAHVRLPVALEHVHADLAGL